MHRSISLLAVAAIVAASFLVVAPASPAEAAVSQTSIDFNGAGWGHGVGMSQYGAQARALDGQSYVDILEAYYTDDATVGTLGQGGLPDPGLLYTNVASDIISTTFTVISGPVTPRTGMLVTHNTGTATPPSAVLHTNDTVVIVDTTPGRDEIGGCKVTVTVASVATVWTENGSCDLSVALTTGGAEPTNLVKATNCRRPTECTYGYGTAFQTIDNGSFQRNVLDRTSQPLGPVFAGFDLVVSTTMDEYTKGIAEVPFSWHEDALMAQAVAARSFAASFNVSTNHKDAGCFCDVKNDSSYQVYAGWIGHRVLADRWDAAAEATNGQVVTHPAAPDLGIVRAYYSSSNGGASEWVKEKWGGVLPYLMSVPDHWSLEPPNPRASWTFSEDADHVVDKIWGTSADYTLIGAAVIANNASGSAKTIRFTALAQGDVQITKDVSVGAVTSAFGLYSWYFSIDDTRLITPPPADSDGVGVQDPRTGIWTLRAPDGDVTSFYYGNPNDIPYAGDWNGNGQETVGLYRESTGYLFLRNTNDQGIADIEIYYGNPGDLPIAGDWDGDGVDTVGIYRRGDNTFYLRNTNTQGIADVVVPFGDAGDVPLAGDWDGDGIDTIGVYRPSTRMVYLVNDLNHPAADISFFYNGAASGDKVVAGDWDDDGDDTLGVFRPSNAMWYLRDTFEQSTANTVFEFGSGWMDPIAGYWGN